MHIVCSICSLLYVAFVPIWNYSQCLHMRSFSCMLCSQGGLLYRLCSLMPLLYILCSYCRTWTSCKCCIIAGRCVYKQVISDFDIQSTFGYFGKQFVIRPLDDILKMQKNEINFFLDYSWISWITKFLEIGCEIEIGVCEFVNLLVSHEWNRIFSKLRCQLRKKWKILCYTLFQK